MPARIDPEVAVAQMRSAGVEPLEPYRTTATPWKSRCLTCGNAVSPRLNSIRNGQAACRYCAGKAVNPETAVADMRASGVEPLDPYPGANLPWRSSCLECGVETSPTLSSVRRGSHGCRACAYRRVGERRRVDPEAAVAEMLAVGAEPLEPYVNMVTPWRSRCLTCGNEIAPRLDGIRRGGGACKFCAPNAPISEETALADMRAAGVEPLDPYPGYLLPWRSLCLTCATEGAPRLKWVRATGNACDTCSKARAAEQLREDPEVAVAEMRAAGVEPLEPYPGAHTPWKSRCLRCGTEGSPTLINIRHAGSGGCLRCGRERTSERQRVDLEIATAEMRAGGFEPLEPYVSANAPWRCQCLECGLESDPTRSSVNQGRRCRYCADHGFDYAGPATVYLFVHRQHRALKIGITGQTTDRLSVHESKGWSLVDLWFFGVGDEAAAVEQAVLEAWRGYPHAVTATEMPQRGYTETVSLDRVTEDEAVSAINSEIALRADANRPD